MFTFFTMFTMFFFLSLGHSRLKIGNLSGNTNKSGLTVHKLMYDEHLIQCGEALKEAIAEYKF